MHTWGYAVVIGVNAGAATFNILVAAVNKNAKAFAPSAISIGIIAGFLVAAIR